jgi:hypothetical protein
MLLISSLDPLNTCFQSWKMMGRVLLGDLVHKCHKPPHYQVGILYEDAYLYI